MVDLAGRIFDSSRDLHEEWVVEVENDQADRGAASPTQLAGGGGPHETDLLDRLLHALQCLLSNQIGSVEHVGDGADGDVRALRDVPNGGLAHRGDSNS